MTALNGRRVLVTGAAGFIGANLVAALESAGADVHGIVRASTDRWRLEGLAAALTVHTADVADVDAVGSIVRDVQPDVVVHAAAFAGHPSTPSARLVALRDTVLSAAAVCEALAASGRGRLVHLGSSLEYGQAAVPLDEARPLTPETFRGASKAGATLLCRQMASEAGTSVILLRLFSVYGPWEPASRFVPTVMRALQSGGDLPLTRPGVRRDFVFVGDVVDACLRAATAEGLDGEIINVGSGRQSTNEELAEAAQQVTGIRIRVLTGAYPARRVDTSHWVADIGKAKRLLGWSPAYTLDRGLAETWRWFTEHRERYEAYAARAGR
jgi:nucleoside-diphosphate-sugar epimerase